jgi:hypothetical protein
MVPMRVIFEALGADIEWNDSTRTISATRGDLVVRTTVGNRVIDVNGNQITMDTAPVIINGRTLVPIRFVSEALGSGVAWDSSTRTVFITSAIDNHSPITESSDDEGGLWDDDWDLDDWDWGI